MKPTGQSDVFANAFDIPVSYVERLQAAAAARCPLFEAARPLLQALRNTPDELDQDAVPARRQWLLNEARMFERVCSGLQLTRTDVENARYCLCSALDEAAMQTPWGKGAGSGIEWSANGLATTLGYDRLGADRVFSLIDSAIQNPGAQGDLLAVLQQIVASGFMGRYRRAPDGARRLQAIRSSLDRAVAMSLDAPGATRSARPKEPIASEQREDPDDNSPVPHPVTGAARRSAPAHGFVDVPFRMASSTPTSQQGRVSRARWVLSGVLGAALIAAVGLCLHRLYTGATAPAPASPVTLIGESIRSALPQEIATGVVSLQENGDHSRLAIRVDSMFAPGQYALIPAAWASLAQVGRAVATVRADVLVHLTGYTDGTPFENPNGLSNQSLSALRAQTVMQVLAIAGVSPERITVSGNGESSPLDDNHTRAGRARNRRVEIAVEQLK